MYMVDRVPRRYGDVYVESDLKDIVTTLSARPEPVSYSELHNLLLNHEFIHGQSLSQLSISSAMSDQVQSPIANFSQRSPSNFDRNQYNNSFRGRGRNSKAAHLAQQAPIQSTQNWYPDFRAMHNITPDLSSLSQYEEYRGNDQLHVGNGQSLPIQHTEYLDKYVRVGDDFEGSMHAIVDKKTDEYVVVHCSRDTEEVE
ncbi:hypothetical protein BC332_24238 [Capsicum chinense]|nr:hypothetical protein BC332_24238 [Capsicum chinense]